MSAQVVICCGARRTPSSPLWQVIAVLAVAGAVVWAWMLEMRVPS